MVTKTDLLLDVLDQYPHTLEIMRDFEKETSTCICCEQLFATIEEIAEHYRIDLSHLLERLNADC